MTDPIKRIRQQAEQHHRDAVASEEQARALELAADHLEAADQQHGDAEMNGGNDQMGDDESPPVRGRRGPRR
jgi:hypothetical protein